MHHSRFGGSIVVLPKRFKLATVLYIIIYSRKPEINSGLYPFVGIPSTARTIFRVSGKLLVCFANKRLSAVACLFIDVDLSVSLFTGDYSLQGFNSQSVIRNAGKQLCHSAVLHGNGFCAIRSRYAGPLIGNAVATIL